MRFLVPFMLCSCSLQATSTPINAPPAAMTARAPASVEVFTSGTPTRAHVDVALIQVDPEPLADDSTSNLLVALRGKAAAMGCDAVV